MKKKYYYVIIEMYELLISDVRLFNSQKARDAVYNKLLKEQGYNTEKEYNDALENEFLKWEIHCWDVPMETLNDILVEEI